MCGLSWRKVGRSIELVIEYPSSAVAEIGILHAMGYLYLYVYTAYEYCVVAIFLEDVTHIYHFCIKILDYVISAIV